MQLARSRLHSSIRTYIAGQRMHSAILGQVGLLLRVHLYRSGYKNPPKITQCAPNLDVLNVVFLQSLGTLNSISVVILKKAAWIFGHTSLSNCCSKCTNLSCGLDSRPCKHVCMQQSLLLTTECTGWWLATHLQHHTILWQQGLDMSQELQAGDDHRIIVMGHSLPGLLEDCFPSAQEEIHGLFDEAVQHMSSVC